MAHVKDCITVAKNATINDYYNLTVTDVSKLLNAYRNDPATLAIECFKFGYVQGEKAARAEIKTGIAAAAAKSRREAEA